MDAFGIVGFVVEGILGLFTPGPTTDDGTSVLQRSRKRFPSATRMLAREPSIDDGRPIVVVVAEEGLVVLGEDGTATTAEWDSVRAVAHQPSRPLRG